MGVTSDNWFDCVFTLNSLHGQTLMLTDVQIPFLWTPLLPLNVSSVERVRAAGMRARRLASARLPQRRRGARTSPDAFAILEGEPLV